MVSADLSPRAAASVLCQKQPGFVRVRVAFPAGDVPAAVADQLAAIADRFGRGEIRATPRHELEIPFVKESDAEEVVQYIGRLELNSDGPLPCPNIVACPGADQCTSAYVKTKKVCHDVEEFLRDTAGNGVVPPDLRVAISGCPNECSHARINDVGFVGAVGSFGGRKLRGFELVVGGSAREAGRLAERIAFVSPEDAVSTLRDLIEVYRDAAPPRSSLADFVLGIGSEELSRLMQSKLGQRMWFFEI